MQRLARSFVALLTCVLVPSTARADTVDLFPKKALQKQASAPSDSVEIPIDSPWRSVERKAYELFAPRAAEVSDENGAKLLARQIARERRPAAAPRDRNHDDSRALPSDPMGYHASVTDQVSAAQRAYEEPVTWQAVELEVRVERDGRPGEVRITQRSGRPAVDRAAVEAVRRAVGAGSALGDSGAVIARFRVEAGVSVAMRASAIRYEPIARPKGVMVPIVRGRFGDGKKTEVSGPLQPRVRTRVSLIGIESAR